jgi:hypothetical protein
VLTVVAEGGQRREDVSLLDDIVRESARRMLAAALEADAGGAGGIGSTQCLTRLSEHFSWSGTGERIRAVPSLR